MDLIYYIELTITIGLNTYYSYCAVCNNIYYYNIQARKYETSYVLFLCHHIFQLSSNIDQSRVLVSMDLNSILLKLYIIYTNIVSMIYVYYMYIIVIRHYFINTYNTISILPK